MSQGSPELLAGLAKIDPRQPMGTALYDALLRLEPIGTVCGGRVVRLEPTSTTRVR